MIRPTFARFLAVLLAAGACASSLPGQQAGAEPSEAPRLTPEERRAQWEQLRDLNPEERRARFEQWRESRRAREERAREGAPEGPPPENYLEQLEFRSILTLDGVTEFSLRNPWEGRTLLVSEGEPRHEIEVVEFDRETNALTLRHGDDTRTLHLQAARVVAIEESNPDFGRRGEFMEARRQRFQEFRAIWREAAADSPELQQIENQFRELVADFRENRTQLRDMDPNSPEYDRLRAQEQEMREEFRLLTEYSLLEVRRHPAFDVQDVDSFERMMRGMMFRGDGDGRRGAWRRPETDQ